MADFEKAYRRLDRAEGGYQKMATDKGNYNSLGMLVGTNWGISAPKYERLIGRPPTEPDMRNMPKWRAKDAFRNDEWAEMRGDDIPSQPLAEIIFDGLVNHGYGTWLLQDVLGLKKDNGYGPITHAAVLSADPAKLYNAYKQRRVRYYHKLVADDPTQKAHLKGWLNRINSFTDFVGQAVQQGAQVVKNNPGASLGMAVGAGLVLWWMLKK